MTDETPTQPTAREGRTVAYGSTIKAAGDGRFEGYLVYFRKDGDSNDLHGEYFTKATDFALDQFPIVGHAFLLYHHGQDDTLGNENYGVFTKARVDDSGLWVEGQIELAKQYARDIEKLMRDGYLFFSSGSVPQLTRVGKSGHIERWPIVEGSFTPTPAQPVKTRIQPAKALTDVPSFKDLLTGEETRARAAAKAKLSQDLLQKRSAAAQRAIKGASEMDLSHLVAAIAAELGAELSAEELMTIVDKLGTSNAEEVAVIDEAEPEILSAALNEEELDEEAKASDTDDEEEEKKKRVAKAAQTLSGIIAKRVRAMTEAKSGKLFAGLAKTAADAVGSPSGPAKGSVKNKGMGQQPTPAGLHQPRIQVGENLKFARLTAGEMALGAQMLNAYYNPKNKPGTTLGDIGLSEDYLKHMAQKMDRKAGEMESRGSYAMKSMLPWKANELNATTITNQGAEWIERTVGEDFWETPRPDSLWDKLVAAGMRVRELGQGESSYEIKKEGADAIVYSPPEATDIDAITNQVLPTYKQSAFGTAEQNIAPGKIGARVIPTAELEEDSIVPILAHLHKKMYDTMLEHRDMLLTNADSATAANTNINLIDGTPPTGINRPYYLATNGLRKLGLVTYSAQAVDAQGENNVFLFEAARSLLREVYQEKESGLVLLTDFVTGQSTMRYPELTTTDVAAGYGTIENGRVKQLFTSPLIATSYVARSNTAGKVSATPANNNRGTIIALWADALMAVVKRAITIKHVVYPHSDTTEFVASTRLGLGLLDALAIGVVYNVGSTRR